MTLRNACQTLGIPMFIAVVVPYVSIAQSTLGSLAERERQIIDKVQTEQSRNGPYSEGLMEPLLALSLFYEEGGDYLSAEAAIQQVLQVVRVNYGLHSLEQAPLIRDLINRQLARGSVAEAWDLEQELLALAERHPNDLRTARILRETADGRMDVLRRYSAGEFPQEIILGCYYDEPLAHSVEARLERTCDSGSRGRAKRLLLQEAQSLYAESVNVILRNEDHASDELARLLMELVHSSYRNGNYALGRRSLRYLLAYEATNSEAWLPRIEALVQLADWELLYARHLGTKLRESALASYEQAYALLEEHTIARESIDEIFSPPMPVVLPSFVPNPLVSEERPGSRGFIDVSFVIADDGKASRIDIRDSTTNATRGDERALVTTIKRSRFRPRMLGDRLSASAEVSFRYYLND